MKKLISLLTVFVLLTLALIPVASAACDHKWMTESFTAATCTTGSRSVQRCIKCGQSKQSSGPALGHSWTAPTCTTAAKCRRCGISGNKATGHSWEILLIDDLDKDLVAQFALWLRGDPIKRYHFLCQCWKCGEKRDFYFDENPGYQKGDLLPK